MAERFASREGIGDVGRVGEKARRGARGANTGRELLDKHHGQDHLTYERCSLLPAGAPKLLRIDRWERPGRRVQFF
jgi:hypothetical protein